MYQYPPPPSPRCSPLEPGRRVVEEERQKVIPTIITTISHPTAIITKMFTYRARATSSQGGAADLCLALLDGGREPAIEDFNSKIVYTKKLSLSEIAEIIFIVIYICDPIECP